MSTNIQGLGAQVNPLGVGGSSAQSGSADQPDFAQIVRDGMNQVDNLQQDAANKAEQMLAGDGQDVHSAMIAVQKAELSFQLMMQVRNKIVQAYQEVSRMSF